MHPWADLESWVTLSWVRPGSLLVPLSDLSWALDGQVRVFPSFTLPVFILGMGHTFTARPDLALV